MARARNAPYTKRRHKKVLKAAKGYFGARRKLYKMAKETLERAWIFATIHRRRKKREFRALWNARISAEARQNGINYSRFMHGLKRAQVKINRKMLSEIAQIDKPAFKQLVKIAKK